MGRPCEGSVAGVGRYVLGTAPPFRNVSPTGCAISAVEPCFDAYATRTFVAPPRSRSAEPASSAGPPGTGPANYGPFCCLPSALIVGLGLRSPLLPSQRPVPGCTRWTIPGRPDIRSPDACFPCDAAALTSLPKSSRTSCLLAGGVKTARHPGLRERPPLRISRSRAPSKRWREIARRRQPLARDRPGPRPANDRADEDHCCNRVQGQVRARRVLARIRANRRAGDAPEHAVSVRREPLLDWATTRSGGDHAGSRERQQRVASRTTHPLSNGRRTRGGDPTGAPTRVLLPFQTSTVSRATGDFCFHAIGCLLIARSLASTSSFARLLPGEFGSEDAAGDCSCWSSGPSV